MIGAERKETGAVARTQADTFNEGIVPIVGQSDFLECCKNAE